MHAPGQEAREKEAEPKCKAGDEGREGEKAAKATRPWTADEQESFFFLFMTLEPRVE